VSWNFHCLAPGAHPEEAIDIIGSLGLESVGFGGFLSLEQDGAAAEMQETCRRYVSMMKEYLS